jgi:hypothetical protein
MGGISFLELFMEWDRPKPIGIVEIAGARPKPRNPVLVIILFIAAWFVLVTPFIILFFFLPQPFCFIAIAIFYLIYLPLGYFIRPRPRMDNLGLFGPFIGNPFRYSDDLNRFLLNLMIMLFPGRLVSTWIVDFFVMVYLQSRKRYY